MNNTFEDIRKEFESMVSNFETFTEKSNNAAGTRTRKHLLGLKKLAHELRKQISEEIAGRKKGKKSSPAKKSPAKKSPNKKSPNKNNVVVEEEENEENEEEEVEE